MTDQELEAPVAESAPPASVAAADAEPEHEVETTAPEPAPTAAGPEPETAAGEPAPALSAAPEPARPERERVSAGRYVADALRAAGVKYAFTVPGESFLGLLDALEGAGIR